MTNDSLVDVFDAKFEFKLMYLFVFVFDANFDLDICINSLLLSLLPGANEV